jgi:hypothetical protein
MNPQPDWIKELEDPTRLDRALEQQKKDDTPSVYMHRAMMNPEPRQPRRVRINPQAPKGS